MYKDVAANVSHRRKKAVAAHNKAINIVGLRFEIRNHVLARRAADRKHKLQYKWFDPPCNEQAHSPFVYSVAKFNSTEQQRVHATRVIRYYPKLQSSKKPKETMDLADHTTTK